MKRALLLLLAVTLFGVAAPLQAQDQSDPVAWAYFVRTTDADYEDLQEGIRRHSDWHAQQNDPWPWMVYEATTGSLPEFVIMSPGHTWTDFDNRPVDGAADGANWGETAGPFVTDSESTIWTTKLAWSRPPPQDATIPMWQVIEWDIRPGSEAYQALETSFLRLKQAFDELGSPFRYTVNEIFSGMGGPQMFVGIPRQGFAELEGGDPYGLLNLLTGAYGHQDALTYLRAFDKNLMPTANRIWVLREDLSHVPGM